MTYCIQVSELRPLSRRYRAWKLEAFSISEELLTDKQQTCYIYGSKFRRENMRLQMFALVVLCGPVTGQTLVPILQQGVLNNDHLLFNRSYQYDQADHDGVPWTFYYANVSSQPPSGTRRSTCANVRVDAAPYGNTPSGATYFDWFNYPLPPGTPADGQYPYAPVTEFLESTFNGSGMQGFEFEGEFGGAVTSPTPHTSGSLFQEAVFFTDRPCYDAGTEYGWFRTPALYAFPYDQPVSSVTFYYSDFNNCDIDFACYDTNGKIVQSNIATIPITGIPLNSGNQDRAYKFKVTRSGSTFQIQLIDIATGANPTGCSASIYDYYYTSSGIHYDWEYPGLVLGTDTTCSFSVPIASWYPGTSVTGSGYVSLGTQSSRVYPPPTGSPRGTGGPPPTNVPTLSALTATNLWALY